MTSLTPEEGRVDKMNYSYTQISPLSPLPAQLSPPLSGWMAREGYTCGHDLRPLL